MLNTGYTTRPHLKDVQTVINFDLPETYTNYKENGMLVNEESGCVLSLINPSKKEEMETLSQLQHKF